MDNNFHFPVFMGRNYSNNVKTFLTELIQHRKYSVCCFVLFFETVSLCSLVWPQTPGCLALVSWVPGCWMTTRIRGRHQHSRLCMFMNVHVCELLTQAREGHLDPRSWGYMCLCAAQYGFCGLNFHSLIEQ